VELSREAFDEQNFEVHNRLSNVLQKNPNVKYFLIEIERPVVSQLAKKNNHPEMLGIPYISPQEEKQLFGKNTIALGKAVKPDDIYQYVTDLMLNTIKIAGNLPWQTMWEKSSLGNGKQATNYESKKPYRGINFFLLNFELKFSKEGPYMDWKDWENPYFLTVKQIEK